MQRIFDVVFSFMALLLLSPILLAVALMLRLSGEGEIFFLQERIGQYRKPFQLIKFATMLKNSPNMGTGTVTMKNDPRVLPFGSLLRKSKINELPQLLNIFLGDMSIIGPRPQALRCFNVFPKKEQNIIIQVKPGLSGIGPVVFRGEEEILEGYEGTLDFYDNVIAPYKGQVESWYVDHQTLTIYFCLILMTVWVVIFPKSGLVWRLFKEVPIPPDTLKAFLNYRV